MLGVVAGILSSYRTKEQLQLVAILPPLSTIYLSLMLNLLKAKALTESFRIHAPLEAKGFPTDIGEECVCLPSPRNAEPAIIIPRTIPDDNR